MIYRNPENKARKFFSILSVPLNDYSYNFRQVFSVFAVINALNMISRHLIG